MTYEFSWNDEINFSLGNNETLPSDTLDRAKYAKFLTNYLGNLENKNYVLNLDCEWGAGKSYFLKRWYETIKNLHPSVYVDVWKHDFSNDPLLAITTAITTQLGFIANSTDDENFLSGAGAFIKGIAPELVKGITKKVTGIDYENMEFNGDGDKTFSDIAGAATKQLIKQHEEQVKSIEQFKTAIEAKASALIQYNIKDKEYRNPVFIFIDELDRCRPNYAVETLEIIKHLFDIPKIVFIVATDTQELQHAIKVLYGNNFSSASYLNRFFHRRFTLAPPNTENFLISSDIFSNEQLDRISQKAIWPRIENKHESLIFPLSQICQGLNLELRSIIQISERFMATIVNLEDNTPVLSIYLMGLLALYHYNLDAYKLYKTQKANKFANEALTSFYSQIGNITFSCINQNNVKEPIVKGDISIRDIFSEFRDISSMNKTQIAQGCSTSKRNLTSKVNNHRGAVQSDFVKADYFDFLSQFEFSPNYFDLVEMAGHLG
ncbi:MAG: KAP family NTPase [Thalassotalea sp.]|nr:KAP family NTPase [Thalassotalea sp.]